MSAGPQDAAQRPRTPRPSSSRGAAPQRFLPGVLLAGRYRIVGLLGRGGMGEVYRADDLLLEQPVALKFLRPEIGADAKARERFLSEVKLARAVTHPNVCRVHDLGEMDGLLFLSMEYVDGEDLAALLRRIGAPSEKKALEIAAQLCSGLAAAHARGVLHRDLKPANVMIDGAGKVRITDFGLAILEVDERERGHLAGTPAYMAPEQLAGGETTVRSDIYALGLVLYELFTGLRVWRADDLDHLRRLHATRTPDPPSAHARGLEERIERAILACLQHDPALRPRSTTSVAVTLTGVDPIAAALAAGETPTPEMVAASGGEGSLSPAVALASGAAVVALFLTLLWVTPRASLHGYLTLEDEPAVLAHRARETLRALGLAVEHGDRAYGLIPVEANVRRALRTDAPGDRWQRLDQDLPSAGLLWYREAPSSLQPSAFGARLSADDPPLRSPGMVSLWLSLRGRLDGLEAVPPERSDPARSGARCDWGALFQAAGLSLADFTPSAPLLTPPQGCDERVAWVETEPKEPGSPTRVEGAAFEGRPVFFRRGLPAVPEAAPGSPSRAGRMARVGLELFALLGGILAARRNLAKGRGDRRGAARFALTVLVGSLVAKLLQANHTRDFLGEHAIIAQALSASLYTAAFVWVLYLALEPYVRRLWPDRLVSWSRLLSGRWRDPLVARDLLAGLVLGMLGVLIGHVQAWAGIRLDAPAALPFLANFPDAEGLRGMTAQLCSLTLAGVQAGFVLLFSLVALRVLVRRSWLAYLLLAPLVMLSNPVVIRTGLWPLDWSGSLLSGALLLLLAARFGFFALATGVVTFYFLNAVPLTSELDAWYAGQTIFAGLVIGVLTFLAARFAARKLERFLA